VRTDYQPEAAVVRVIVEDTGPGIPPEDLDKLFSPFVSTKGSRGTGLGLPVSQKILSEHGGRILVDSRPGQGARFTLELPAVLPQKDVALSSSHQPTGAKTVESPEPNAQSAEGRPPGPKPAQR